MRKKGSKNTFRINTRGLRATSRKAMSYLLSATIALAPALSSAQNNLPQSKDGKTTTQDTLTKDELKKFRPSELSRFDQNYRNQMNQMYPGGFTVSTMKRLPREALIFYVAMGATMVQDSLIDPYTKGGRLNPNWLDTLIHEATSPIGLAGFAAFVLASGKTGQLMLQAAHGIEKTSPGIAKSFRGLSGQIGMAAGMIASNIVHEFAYHPDVILCYQSLKKTDNSEIDSQACDRAFDYWVLNPGSRLYDWAPDIFAMLSASFLSSALLNKSPLIALIKKGTPISVKGFMMKLGSLRFGVHPLSQVGMGLLNLYTFMNVHAKVTDPLIARPWKNNRKYNGTLKKYIEIQKEFSELEKKNFHLVKKNPHKIIQLLQDYTEKQDDWRTFNLDLALTAHANWKTSAMELLMSHKTAYLFYHDFFEQQSLFKGQYSSDNPYIKKESHLDEIENNPEIIIPYFKETHPKSVHNINTTRTVDYLLTSMICGPDAENKPNSLIKDPLVGVSYKFVPPRVLENIHPAFCLQRFPVIDRPNKHFQDHYKYNPHDIIIDTSRGTYEGILPLINSHLRRDLIGSTNGVLNFNSWWEKNILPSFNKTVDKLRDEYRKMMTNLFFPAFQSKDFEAIKVSLNQDHYQIWKNQEQQWNIGQHFVPLLRKKNKRRPHLSAGLASKANEEVKELLLPKGITSSLFQEVPIWLNLLQRLNKKFSINNSTFTLYGKILILSLEEMLEAVNFSTIQGKNFNAAYEKALQATSEIARLFKIDLMKIRQMNPQERLELKKLPLEQQIAISSLLRLQDLSQNLENYRAILQLIEDR